MKKSGKLTKWGTVSFSRDLVYIWHGNLRGLYGPSRLRKYFIKNDSFRTRRHELSMTSGVSSSICSLSIRCRNSKPYRSKVTRRLISLYRKVQVHEIACVFLIIFFDSFSHKWEMKGRAGRLGSRGWGDISQATGSCFVNWFSKPTFPLLPSVT